jgi:hypothetical protein
MIISEEGKSKSRTFVVSSIIKKLDKMNLNGEHSQQRDFVWEKIKQYNLISDVLQNNPLPELVFAEQIINSASIIWVIDGKQRCTTLKEHEENKFAIGANVTRYMISYSEPVKDEDGCITRDEDGNVIYEFKEFDIRKKRFKELPDILKEKLLDYAFNVVYYCNCTDDEIAYHIQRYNSGKPMNVAQKGMTFIGKRNSDAVRNILSMSFFVDGIGAYTANQFTSSTMSRVVAESIMTTRFLDNWCKKYEDNCKFLEQNATADDFEDFKSLVLELEDEIECSVGKMFNDTDSFLWFGLYAQFKKIGLKCSDFNIFMNEINKGITRNNKGKIDKKEPMSGICVKEIDGVTLEQLLSNPSTKDTNIVKTKINFLVKLACEYFGLELPSFENEENTMVKEFEDFAQEFVSDEMAYQSLMLISDCPYCSFDFETMQKMEEWLKYNGDIKLLEDCKYYKSIAVDCGIKDDDENLPLYIYAVKYCDTNNINIDIDEWFAEFKDNAFFNVEDDNEQFTNSAIMLKQSEIIKSISEFINKGEDDNETI